MVSKFFIPTIRKRQFGGFELTDNIPVFATKGINGNK